MYRQYLRRVVRHGADGEVISPDGKAFTMDDIIGDGHCLFTCVLVGLDDLQHGVASPDRLLRNAQEQQRGETELTTLDIGEFHGMKVYLWRLVNKTTKHFHFQRISDDEIVLVVMSGPVSVTHHKKPCSFHSFLGQ